MSNCSREECHTPLPLIESSNCTLPCSNNAESDVSTLEPVPNDCSQASNEYTLTNFESPASSNYDSSSSSPFATVAESNKRRRLENDMDVMCDARYSIAGALIELSCQQQNVQYSGTILKSMIQELDDQCICIHCLSDTKPNNRHNIPDCPTKRCFKCLNPENQYANRNFFNCSCSMKRSVKYLCYHCLLPSMDHDGKDFRDCLSCRPTIRGIIREVFYKKHLLQTLTTLVFFKKIMGNDVYCELICYLRDDTSDCQIYEETYWKFYQHCTNCRSMSDAQIMIYQLVKLWYDYYTDSSTQRYGVYLNFTLGQVHSTTAWKNMQRSIILIAFTWNYKNL